MTQVVYDSFDRADSTTTMGNADSGQTWTVDTGGPFGISSNRAYINVGPPTNSIAVVDSGVADAAVRATFVTISVSFGLYLNFRESSSTSRIRFGCPGPGSAYVLETVNPGVTNLGTASQTGTNGDVVTVAFKGTAINCYVNGVVAASATSSVNTSVTRHGIQLLTNAARLDDFAIYTADALSLVVNTRALVRASYW